MNFIMRMYFQCMFIFLIQIVSINMTYSKNIFPADHPFIQYFGRWDFCDNKHPRHDWPGVYIYAEFSGKTIGVCLADSINYYNVYIDDKFHSIFHGRYPDEAGYILADNLEDTRHTFLFSKRNITFNGPFQFSGIILEDNAKLFLPKQKPVRKIEFIGDSYTAAESNESNKQELEWEERYAVTNIDKGFAPLIANHFNAQYHTTCRSGIGMFSDWQGNLSLQMPERFERLFMDSTKPKWDFNTWVPDIVVICLGLNDYSGLKDSANLVPKDKSAMFRKAYAEFLATLRKVYPDVKIVAVAAYENWIRDNVKQVVDDEKDAGNQDIYYAQFDYFEGGYVAYGHPTVETHEKMAKQIIASMESFRLFNK